MAICFVFLRLSQLSFGDGSYCVLSKIACQIGRYVNVSALKHYFNVSNSYVVNKLFLVLFPWRHKPWSRKQAVGANGQEGWYLPPREDVNSPDMYIPGTASPLPRTC